MEGPGGGGVHGAGDQGVWCDWICLCDARKKLHMLKEPVELPWVGEGDNPKWEN